MNKKIAFWGAVVLITLTLSGCVGYGGYGYQRHPYGYGSFGYRYDDNDYSYRHHDRHHDDRDNRRSPWR